MNSESSLDAKMIEIEIRNAKLLPFREAIVQVVATVDVDDPPALGILCNGSMPLGTATGASDLDLCICCDAPISRFIRKPFARQVIDLHFEDGRWLRSARPPYDVTALFMLAGAEVLWERYGLLTRHVTAATYQLSQPAPALSDWEQFLLKIDCSTRLKRLSEAKRHANFAFLLGGLFEKTIEATLRLNRRWYLDTGHGVRDLQAHLADKAQTLSQIAALVEQETIAKEMAEYLSDLFGASMPLEEWDSGEINHCASPMADAGDVR